MRDSFNKKEIKLIDNIIIHSSDSPWGTAREIKLWHTDLPPRGRGWSDIGYHFIILNGKPVDSSFYLEPLDGSIECGRRLDGDMDIEPDEVGIHTLGYNKSSIGICMIGMKLDRITFTIRQFDALKGLLIALCQHYKIDSNKVLGHCETISGKKQGKTCPEFDVAPFRTWLKGRV